MKLVQKKCKIWAKESKTISENATKELQQKELDLIKPIMEKAQSCN